MYGADVNKPDDLNSNTPLHYAASEGHSACLELLISQGVHTEFCNGTMMCIPFLHKTQCTEYGEGPN